MKTCKWCNSFGTLIKYKGVEICERCKNSVENSVCIKCKNPFPEEMMHNGLCLNCQQVAETVKHKQREEAKFDIITNKESASYMHVTEEIFEQILTFRAFEDSYSPKDLKRSPMLRKLWALIKVSANRDGTLEERLINENMEDIEDLMLENIGSLVGQKCDLYIIENMKDRKAIQGKECIAHKGKVYIVKV